ncbi:MAG: hypothetical protein ACRC1R_08040 [Cetobacterium sp.]|uniref:hypothetical protein n=1 Tax=Cetobacterium sp. TaxID=2071632 RepID=UPI003F356FC9
MVSKENIKNFFQMLNLSGIEYVLIKNDGNIIPNEVKDGDDIDILVHPRDYEKYIELLEKKEYRILPGESYKYYFVYNMRKDIYSQKEDVYIHCYDKLSCVSFTNMGLSKIPLDKKIQDYIWKTKRWDEDNQWWIMEDRVILLYLIVRSIFDKKKFRDRYIEEIIKRKQFLRDKEFLKMCNLVFFKFTEKLLILLENEKYNEILKEYKSFREY